MQNSMAWYSAAITIGLLQASKQRCFTPSLQGIDLGHPRNQPFQGRGNVELLLEGVESFVGPSGAIKHPGPVCFPVWVEGLSASHQNPGQAFLNHPTTDVWVVPNRVSDPATWPISSEGHWELSALCGIKKFHYLWRRAGTLSSLRSSHPHQENGWGWIHLVSPIAFYPAARRWAEESLLFPAAQARSALACMDVANFWLCPFSHITVPPFGLCLQTNFYLWRTNFWACTWPNDP